MKLLESIIAYSDGYCSERMFMKRDVQLFVMKWFIKSLQLKRVDPYTAERTLSFGLSKQYVLLLMKNEKIRLILYD